MDNTDVGWFKPSYTKLSFADIGYPQFWVKLRDAGSFLYKDTIKYEDVGDNVDRSQSEGMIAERIMEWNITSPETGVPLPTPTLVDPKPLHELPNIFIFFIIDRIRQESQELASGDFIKKAIESRRGTAS